VARLPQRPAASTRAGRRVSQTTPTRLTSAPRLLGFPIAIATATTPVALAGTSRVDERSRPAMRTPSGESRVANVTARGRQGVDRAPANESAPNPTQPASATSTTISSTTRIETQAPAKRAGAVEYTETQALQDAFASYEAVKPALADPAKRETLIRALRRANVELVRLDGTSVGSLDPATQLVYQRNRPDLPPRRVPVVGR
ncbi:MAG: hypothetical protein AAB250_06880, partial [Bdellovibrionota bacterium]